MSITTEIEEADMGVLSALQFLGADAAEADAGTTLAEHMAGQQKQQGGDKFLTFISVAGSPAL
jgi:hypothetical protein